MTIIIFSEFVRRATYNGKGIDNGTALPMLVIGGNNLKKSLEKTQIYLIWIMAI